MEYINKDLLKLCCKYLKRDELNEFRQCSIYLSYVIGRIYFEYLLVSVQQLNNINKPDFRSFVHKYFISLDIYYVQDLKQLSYLRTFNSIHAISIIIKFDVLELNHMLPMSLKELNIYTLFNKEIQLEWLTSLTFLMDLKFIGSFNQKIKKNIFPPLLENLTFGFDFDKKIEENILPTSLKNLKFGWKFNQPIEENVLPTTLQTLNFGVDFNQKITHLPSSLTSLKFGCNFNQEILNLPPLLTSLTFGHHFDQEILNLPPLLTSLTLGYRFNKNLNNILPISLKTLTLANWTHEKIDTIIPDANIKYPLLKINITR
jgi:hypothetical protein